MNKLEKNILLTLIFFGILQKSLTEREFYELLWQKETNFNEFKKALQKLVKAGKIEKSDKYYYLPGNKNIITKIVKKEALSKKYWREAKKVIKLLARAPFVKMIAVSGSLALENVNKNSDIDLVILSDKKHLRLTRDITIVMLAMLKRLVRQCSSKIKFGPDIFMDFRNSSLESVAEGFLGFRRMYSVYLTALAKPVYIKKNAHLSYQKNNNWLKHYLPNFQYRDWRKYEIKKRNITQQTFESFFKTGFGRKIKKRINEKQYVRLEKVKKMLGEKNIINEDDRIIQLPAAGKKWLDFEKKFHELLTRYKLI